MSDRIGAAEKNQRSCWKIGRKHSEQQAQQLSTTQHDKDKTPEQRKCACARQTFAVCLRSLAAARHLKPNQNTSIQFSWIVWVGAFGWAYFFFVSVFLCSEELFTSAYTFPTIYLFFCLLVIRRDGWRLEFRNRREAAQHKVCIYFQLFFVVLLCLSCIFVHLLQAIALSWCFSRVRQI